MLEGNIVEIHDLKKDLASYPKAIFVRWIDSDPQNIRAIVQYLNDSFFAVVKLEDIKYNIARNMDERTKI